MRYKEEEIMEILRKSIDADNFIAVAYDAVDMMEESKTPFDFIEPILQLMEDFPEADFGLPGPLTHFVEKFYKKGYEELLYQSVKRKPTVQTLSMLDRIINDPNLANKEEYLDLLNEIRN